MANTLSKTSPAGVQTARLRQGGLDLQTMTYLRRRRKRRKSGAVGMSEDTPTTLEVTPRLLPMDTIMTEGGIIVFNVCRKHAYGTCEVDYAITDGTALANIDYNSAADGLTGTLAFADRELFKTVSIQTIARASAQGNRTLTCTLSNPHGVTIDVASAVGTIQDGTVTTFTSSNSIATIAAALEAASPGDAVLLQRGNEWDGATSIILETVRGTAANPIIFGAAGTSGAKPKINLTASMTAGLWFRGSTTSGLEPSDVITQDIVFTSTGVPGNRPGFAISAQETTRTFKPVNLSFLRVEALTNHTGMNLDHSGHTVECCVIKDNYGIDPETGHTHGLFLPAESCEIRFNEFENNGKTSVIFDWHIYLSTSNNSTCEYNRMKDGVNAIKVRTGSGITVRGNEVYNAEIVGLSMGTDSGGPDLTGFVAEENYIHAGQDGFYIATQSGVVSGNNASGIVRNNIVNVTDAGGLKALSFASDSGNINWEIYNNTFLSAKTAFLASEVITGSLIRNNIFYRTDVDGTSPVVNLASAAVQASFTASNNLYFGNGADVYGVTGAANTPYVDLAAYNIDFPGAEADSVEGDPLFTDLAGYDFSLAAGSPAIGTGFDTIADVPDDFVAFARSLPLDIGALEAVPSFNPVAFDGVTYLSAISGAEPVAPRMTFATRIRTPLSNRQYILGPGGNFRYRIETTGVISLSIDDDLGGVVFVGNSAADTIIADQWHNLVIHVNLVEGGTVLRVDGVTVLSNGNTNANNVDTAGLTTFSSNTTDEFVGDVDFAWLNVGDAVTIAALETAMFDGAAGAHKLLSGGVADGITPDMYQAGNAAAWNSGVGIVGSYTMNGAVTDA